MAKETWITIEIVNWDKYNPKRDQQTYTWFRLDNSIATDPDLFGLDAGQKFLWIAVLCEASKKNMGTVRLSLGYLEHVSGLKRAKILETFEFLQQKPSCRIHDNARSPDDATTTPTYVRDVRHETDVRTLAPDSRPTAGGLVWAKYKAAFEKRHGSAPPWNAKTAAMLKQFVARIPAEEAPEVAEFYLTHNDSYYVRNLHPVGMLLKDAEKLRTEWATGRQMTGGQARQVDRRQTNFNAFAGLLAEAEAKEREAGNG